MKIIDFTNCKLSNRNLQYGGRAGEKRGIVYNDENKLMSSALNGITAYEDENQNMITAINMLYIVYNLTPNLLKEVYDTFINNLKNIEEMIYNIPTTYKNNIFMSDIRKKYYLETLNIRLTYIKNKYKF